MSFTDTQVQALAGKLSAKHVRTWRATQKASDAAGADQQVDQAEAEASER